MQSFRRATPTCAETRSVIRKSYINEHSSVDRIYLLRCAIRLLTYGRMCSHLPSETAQMPQRICGEKVDSSTHPPHPGPRVRLSDKAGEHRVRYGLNEASKVELIVTASEECYPRDFLSPEIRNFFLEMHAYNHFFPERSTSLAVMITNVS